MKKVKDECWDERPDLGANEVSRQLNGKGNPVETPLPSPLITDHLSPQFLTALRQALEPMTVPSGSTTILRAVSQNTPPAQAGFQSHRVLEGRKDLLTKRLDEISELIARQTDGLANTGEQMNTAYRKLQEGMESLNRSMGKFEEYLHLYKVKSED